MYSCVCAIEVQVIRLACNYASHVVLHVSIRIMEGGICSDHVAADMLA